MPIEELLRYADWAVSLSSPEMLLACAAGLKPVQIGRAFFGGKGFTHDFSGEDGFLSALCDGRIEPQLSLDEYRRFEDFLIRALVLHLVPAIARAKRRSPLVWPSRTMCRVRTRSGLAHGRKPPPGASRVR